MPLRFTHNCKQIGRRRAGELFTANYFACGDGAAQSAQHASQHSASGTEGENCEEIHGECGNSPVYPDGDQGEDKEIQYAHHKPPQEFAAALPLSRNEAGEEGYNNVNPGNADGYHPLREREAVEQE